MSGVWTITFLFYVLYILMPSIINLIMWGLLSLFSLSLTWWERGKGGIGRGTLTQRPMGNGDMVRVFNITLHVKTKTNIYIGVGRGCHLWMCTHSSDRVEETSCSGNWIKDRSNSETDTIIIHLPRHRPTKLPTSPTKLQPPFKFWRKSIPLDNFSAFKFSALFQVELNNRFSLVLITIRAKRK